MRQQKGHYRAKLNRSGLKVAKEASDYYRTSKLCREFEKSADISEFRDHKNVLLYEELIELVKNKRGLSVEEIRNKENEITKAEKENGTDLREIPINIIRYFLGELGINDSVIVLYFAPPYCPHNMLQKECASLEDDLKNIARKVGEEAKLEYRFMHFFPSLSDSSYLKIDDSDESIEKLKGNFPVMEQLYPVPLEKIKKINILKKKKTN